MCRAWCRCRARCSTGSRSQQRTTREGGQLGVLGTQRSASAGDGSGSGGFAGEGPGGPGGPTRPLRTRRRFRAAVWIAKVVLTLLVVFAAAVGLLFALTPSASQATALTQAQARARNIAY